MLLLINLTSCIAQSGNSLKVGDQVPGFSLLNENNQMFRIDDYLGKKILVIYFYPKDESAVCTKEACAFRDNYEAFTRAGAMVIGINSGTVASHKKFIEDDHLPFTLLSDSGNVVLQKFGVKNVFWLTGRETFVVDLSGKIVYTFNSMIEGEAHANETLKFIQQNSQLR
jgi:thioredoxin-dependent peroxiredoxin